MRSDFLKVREEQLHPEQLSLICHIFPSTDSFIFFIFQNRSLIFRYADDCVDCGDSTVIIDDGYVDDCDDCYGDTVVVDDGYADDCDDCYGDSVVVDY